MKHTSKFLLVLSTVVFAAAAMFVANQNSSTVQQNVSAADASENHKARVKQGLGELKFSSSSSENTIAASVKSLSEFMEYRSGVVINPDAQKLLVSQEQNFRLNNKNSISLVELSDLIAETLMKRVATWSEQETASAIESWKGLDHPDLPESYKKGRSRIKLRANGAGIKTDELYGFLSALKQGNGEVPESYLSFIKRELINRTENKYKFLSELMPEQFPPSEQNVSPFNSMLLAYSIIADDSLAGSMDGLTRELNSIYEWHKKKDGKYPSSAGFKAYGPNGYKYSSPTDILLDDNGINIFLNGLQNKGANK
jgi:hypothetical protein